MRKGLLVGVAVFALTLPAAVKFLPMLSPAPEVAQAQPVAAVAVPVQPVTKPRQQPLQVHPQAPSVQDAQATRAAVRIAHFGKEKASRDVRQMANWVLSSGDHGRMSFVIVDKKNAKVFLFDPAGRIKTATPALMGAARGDDSAPGIGEKPLSQVLPEEKTTPAGRFTAEIGMNTNGEDIVWVDYDAAVSMHRVRNVKSERRLERLTSPTIADNRISFGCINLPVAFYEKALKPTVQSGGAIVYVLPETRPLQETFAGFYDVKAPVKVAQR
jgi:hypothetical protein